MKALYPTLLAKDILIELRSGQALLPQVSLALIISIVGCFGLSSTFLDPQTVSRFVPGVLWLVSILVVCVTAERTIQSEIKDGAIDWILLSGVSVQALYLSKATINFVIASISHFICLSVFFVFFKIGFSAELAVVSLFGVLGLSLLLTLLSALSIQSKLGSILLPILALPLLFPIFFAAVELYLSVILLEELSILSSAWFWIIVWIDLLLLMLGLLLFKKAFAE